MNKLLSTLAIIAILLSMTACSSSKMYIEKAELTPQEQAIMEFVGSEIQPYILNFVVDYTLKSLRINTYELQGVDWVLLASLDEEKLNDSKGRIALTFDNIGLGLKTTVEHAGSSSHKATMDFNFEGYSTSTSYLTDKTVIEYQKEIPLVIQIHSSKDGVSSYTPAYGFYEPKTYAEAEYEKVYAITCVFSQKAIN